MTERKVYNAAIFRRGAKKELFGDREEDDGWDEASELKEKLQGLHDLWAEPRVGREFSAAIWRPELGVAEVVLQKGKLFNHLGYTQGSKFFLHIEEVVYMVDRTNLLLFLGAGRSLHGNLKLLSLQEAHDLMVGCGVSTEQYLVYAKLMRAGYIVQRYPARWILKLSEDPRQLWARWYPPQQQKQESLQQQRVGQQQQIPVLGAAAGVPGEAAAAAAAAAAGGAVMGGTGSRGAATHSAPDAAQPSKPRLPRGCSTAGQNKRRKMEKAAGAVHGGWWQAGLAGLHWLQGLPANYVEELPRCEVAPEGRSKWEAKFPLLAPLPTLPDSELLGLSGAGTVGTSLLDFDVYEPNSRFGRKSAGPPNFRVAVRAPCGPCSHPFLGLEEMAAAERASPGIPVKFATVEDGDISFYGLSQVELRSIL